MSDSVQTLAANMTQRSAAGREPYVLLLGAGAACSSGCSDYVTIAEKFLETRSPAELAEARAIEDEITRRDKTLNLFWQEWRGTGKQNRYAFLSEHLNGSPSRGYADLVWLVRKGHFRVIFTTNIDNMLEKALANAQLAHGEDYELLYNRPGYANEVVRRLRASTPTVKIVKLHGTLADEESYAWLPEEVFEFVSDLREYLAEYVNRDVVILGHRMEDRDLESLFRRRGDEIWYISPGSPLGLRFRMVLQVRSDVHCITGDQADFDAFMSSLRTLTEGTDAATGLKGSDRDITTFLTAVGMRGHAGLSRSPFRNLPDLYVKPAEYARMLEALGDTGLLAIVGEPHTGKTYTALHILWEWFRQGWDVAHFSRDRLAAELYACGTSIDRFAERHLQSRCLVHLDAPFGELSYEPLEGLGEGMRALVRRVKIRGDCALIITSRSSVFQEAVNSSGDPEELGALLVRADLRLHTSYSETMLREILSRYINVYRPGWMADEGVLRGVLENVPEILETPHNVERFARLSSMTSRLDALLGLAYSCRDLIPATAHWIAELPFEQQVLLVLVTYFSYPFFPGLPRSARVGVEKLECLYRSTLGDAYTSGLLDAVMPTAWESGRNALGDVCVLSRDEGEARLTLVHSSYREALDQNMTRDKSVRSALSAVGVVAALDEDEYLRTAAAATLSRFYVHISPAARDAIAQLARDTSPAVRSYVAFGLTWAYGSLDQAGRRIVADLARDTVPQVRRITGDGLASAYRHLDGLGRALLRNLARDRDPSVPDLLASGLAGSYRDLDRTGRRLLHELARHEARVVREWLACGLAFHCTELDAAGYRLLTKLTKLSQPATRREVARRLGSHYEYLNLDGLRLLTQLARDTARVRSGAASGLGRNYGALDEKGRSLLRGLATDSAAEVRLAAAHGLAQRYPELVEEDRGLVERMASDRSARVRDPISRALKTSAPGNT